MNFKPLWLLAPLIFLVMVLVSIKLFWTILLVVAVLAAIVGIVIFLMELLK